MKKLLSLILLMLVICVLSGCASVQIYSSNDLKNKTGLKFYNVKPYLLVELKSEKDMTVKTTVVYLPDLSNPQFLIVKPGIGSNELKMAFTNGVLNSYGLTTDTKVAETITSLAGFLAKSADAAKQFGQPGVIPQQSQEVNFLLYEIVFSDKGTSLKKIGIEE